ncbi:MAG: 4a-hydroxytetrahydrobiopterin dehydratase [Parachlamydia sp.]|nr:4a-hydroxytetrahydrobiopterin dehydratase [Parachlamydia sp.]
MFKAHLSGLYVLTFSLCLFSSATGLNDSSSKRPTKTPKINKRAWAAMESSERELATKKCIPCQGGIPPLKGEEIEKFQKQLGNGWQVIEEHHLEKEYKFTDFRKALTFVNRVGELAEREGHHPDIYLAWGKVKISIWTHKINGLTESDFILAAKCDLL